ncbi:RNA recognition motif 2-domain-containing protein [Zychaea mexicana]|uniref:RNA recognition motif 2-domain-containing protein n=1 Tax=Zychaea mexicana TaxID=64656 RepID=UPI0022FEB0BB|nr:RNA recognition motif 2-domain-containing protein [Zychaea mexicana]KAI9482559.1 RNA recognition motif 2-domain-containing protein [Zychaea mexicana]
MQMLKQEIDATNKGTYDFLYLPSNFHSKRNFGYAFINFSDVGFVITFAEKFGWNQSNSDRRCYLSYADTQGKVALIDKYRNLRVVQEDESCRPKLFYTSGHRIGKEEPFPYPQQT